MAYKNNCFLHLGAGAKRQKWKKVIIVPKIANLQAFCQSCLYNTSETHAFVKLTAWPRNMRLKFQRE